MIFPRLNSTLFLLLVPMVIVLAGCESVLDGTSETAALLGSSETTTEGGVINNADGSQGSGGDAGDGGDLIDVGIKSMDIVIGSQLFKDITTNVQLSVPGVDLVGETVDFYVADTATLQAAIDQGDAATLDDLFPQAFATNTVTLEATASSLAGGFSYTPTVAEIGDWTAVVTLTKKGQTFAKTAFFQFRITEASVGSYEWTVGGFDFKAENVVEGAPINNTDVHVIKVLPGEQATITMSRNANMNDVAGHPDIGGRSFYRRGCIEIGYKVGSQPKQHYTDKHNGGANFAPNGRQEYTTAFKTSVVTEGNPQFVEAWNDMQQPKLILSNSQTLGFTSNHAAFWIVAAGVAVGNVLPSPYCNGNSTYGEMKNAPEVSYPPPYRDPQDRDRLIEAMGNFPKEGGTNNYEVQGAGVPSNKRGGVFWTTLSKRALKNAMWWWYTGSEEHGEKATEQLEHMYRSYLDGPAIGHYWKKQTAPHLDYVTGYGWDLTRTWLNSLFAMMLLSDPGKQGVMTEEQREIIHANLYSYIIRNYDATNKFAYTIADGGHNLNFYDSRLACDIYGESEACNVADKVFSDPTDLAQTIHTLCNFFIDALGIGQYALRYCQKGNPDDKGYLTVGNQQQAQALIRLWEMLKMPAPEEANALKAFVHDHHTGKEYKDVNDFIPAFMHKWQPLP